MRITKVYTRVGDKGTTHLVMGKVVAKDDVRIEAYGTIDELNAIVGMVRTWNGRAPEVTAEAKQIDIVLHRVQNQLFDIGAELATLASDQWESMKLVGDTEVEMLEGWIDEMNDTLPPLEEFILPGGGMVGALSHQARTVCRRAERRISTLMREQPEVGGGPLRYINRLSDLLFVMGRYAAKAHSEPEYLWEHTS